jgi:hypothetical protein
VHDNKVELELEKAYCMTGRQATKSAYQADASQTDPTHRNIRWPPMENVSFGATVRSYRIAHCKSSALGPMASSPSQITSVMRISGARLQLDLELEHGRWFATTHQVYKWGCSKNAFYSTRRSFHGSSDTPEHEARPAHAHMQSWFPSQSTNFMTFLQDFIMNMYSIFYCARPLADTMFLELLR